MSFSIIKCQPSTKINSKILIGKEIITGGNIIIPNAIKVEATIMSTTINGIKIRKPISKLNYSSLKTNAGIKTVMLISSLVLTSSTFAIFKKSAKSLDLT